MMTLVQLNRISLSALSRREIGYLKPGLRKTEVEVIENINSCDMQPMHFDSLSSLFLPCWG